MPHATASISTLSEDASILLAYVQQYAILHDEDEVDAKLRELKFILPDMREDFPLLSFLFDNETRVRVAMNELEGSGAIGIFKRLRAHDVLPTEPSIVDQYVTVIDQYIKHNAEEILDRIWLDDIGHVLASTEIDRYVGLLRECLEFRGNYEFKHASTYSAQYARAKKEPLDCPTGPVEKSKLLELFTEEGGLTLMEEKTRAVVAQHVAVKWFRADSIVPYRHLELCFAALNSDHNQLVQIQELSHEASEAAVILDIGRAPSFRKQLATTLVGCKTVILEHADLKHIALSTDPMAALRSQILKQLPLRFLSPYRTTGPVTGEIFFGCAGELRTILEMPDANYCVLGPRRIGKTSLLHALRDKINREKVLQDTVAIYVDAGKHIRMERFQKHLMSELSNEVDLGWIDPGEEYFEDIADRLKQSRKTYVFLLDEVDRLLQSNDAMSLEAFARSMSNERYARFVFCGYKVLHERIKNRMSPVYNLFDVIRLGPLHETDARELVQQPMTRIGVEFDTDEEISRILNLGANIPWLLQLMCQLLVERLEERGLKRRITHEDVDWVYESRDFSKAMTEVITDEDMPVLMRLIIYLAVDSERDVLRERDIVEAVRKATYAAPFSDIRRALDYLAATYVLKNSGDSYRFFIPQVKQKLRETEPDLPFVISSLAAEYRESISD